VIFLHGGLANTDYWGNQVPAVAAHHTVIWTVAATAAALAMCALTAMTS
jgi:hypothetical protein